MNGTPNLRFSVLTFLGLALALMWFGGAQNARRAEAAGSTPDLAMAIDVNGGGDDCDTRASTGGIGATCSATVGQQFTVKVFVDSIAGLPGSGKYAGFNYLAVKTAGLTANDRTGATEIMWPDCLFGPSAAPSGNNYNATCLTNSGASGSSFVGKIAELDYQCNTTGSQTITQNDASSYLHDENHAPTSDKEGDEVLTISCAAASAVGGIAEQPGVATAPLDASTTSDSNGWLIATLAAAASVGIVAFGGVAWYARRRSHS